MLQTSGTTDELEREFLLDSAWNYHVLNWFNLKSQSNHRHETKRTGNRYNRKANQELSRRFGDDRVGKKGKEHESNHKRQGGWLESSIGFRDVTVIFAVRTYGVSQPCNAEGRHSALEALQIGTFA